MMNKVNALEACESTCHECTPKDKVQSYKEDIVLYERRINQEEGSGK